MNDAAKTLIALVSDFANEIRKANDRGDKDMAKRIRRILQNHGFYGGEDAGKRAQTSFSFAK